MVDFNSVGLVLRQQRQPGKPGAEVIDGKINPRALQFAHRLGKIGHPRNHFPLSELDNNLLRDQVIATNFVEQESHRIRRFDQGHRQQINA